MPASTSGTRCAGTPSSSQPNVPRPPVGRRVGDDVDEVRAVAEALVELVGRQEARARVGGLGAEDAVELGRVAAALVDLEEELRGVEDDRPSARRQHGRREQLDGLLGEAVRPARRGRARGRARSRPRDSRRPTRGSVRRWSSSSSAALTSRLAPTWVMTCSVREPVGARRTSSTRGTRGSRPGSWSRPLTAPIAASAARSSATVVVDRAPRRGPPPSGVSYVPSTGGWSSRTIGSRADARRRAGDADRERGDAVDLGTVSGRSCSRSPRHRRRGRGRRGPRSR